MEAILALLFVQPLFNDVLWLIYIIFMDFSRISPPGRSLWVPSFLPPYLPEYQGQEDISLLEKSFSLIPVKRPPYAISACIASILWKRCQFGSLLFTSDFPCQYDIISLCLIFFRTEHI